MAIITAAKFEYDIATQATAMKIPPNALKAIIRKLFNMAPFSYTPDVVNFIEESKANPPVPDANGVVLASPIEGRLLLNGEDTIMIGLKPGEGTDLASVQAYITKAAPTVYDLSPWQA